MGISQLRTTKMSRQYHLIVVLLAVAFVAANPIQDIKVFDEPASSTGSPASSTEKPASSTGNPTSSTAKPASSTGNPESSTAKPTSSTGNPASSSAKPGSSTGN